MACACVPMSPKVTFVLLFFQSWPFEAGSVLEMPGQGICVEDSCDEIVALDKATNQRLLNFFGDIWGFFNATATCEVKGFY